MPVLILYLFKVSVCLGVIYLFYYLALRNLTFYTWNRWYLLLGTGLSFLIPLVNIMPLLGSREINQLKIIYLIPAVGNFSDTVSGHADAPNSGWAVWSDFILILFGLGLLFRVGKLIGEFISFYRLGRLAACQQEGTVKIYQVNKNIAPFSFGNVIFLNKNLLAPVEMEEIIRHELVHIKQRHTLDVLWLEVVCLVNWYNPFAYFIKRAARENLEFLADNVVLTAPESDKKYYQYLLLKITGLTDFNLANQFNISSLKNRIIMMNKPPSTRPELFKFFFALPLMALLLLACRDNDSDFPDLTPADATQTDLKSDVPPPPPPPEPALVPPPPPPPVILEENSEHQLFRQRNPQVDVLGWQENNTMVLFLKSGEREEYNLNNRETRAAAEKKYGKLPQGPPPPPPSTR